MVPSLFGFPSFSVITPKSHPYPSSFYMYAVPSPINMRDMMIQHTVFPLLLDPPGKPDHQASHCHTTNFEPLLRGSVPDPMFITVFDSYLTPRSPQACV